MHVTVVQAETRSFFIRCQGVSGIADLVTCDGTIKPLWETSGRPVNIGDAHQIVSNDSRRIVYDRDRTGRHPTCNVTRNLRIHHIIHWRAGLQTGARSGAARMSRTAPLSNNNPHL
jgi:hypothetical protein